MHRLSGLLRMWARSFPAPAMSPALQRTQSLPCRRLVGSACSAHHSRVVVWKAKLLSTQGQHLASDWNAGATVVSVADEGCFGMLTEAQSASDPVILAALQIGGDSGAPGSGVGKGDLFKSRNL